MTESFNSNELHLLYTMTKLQIAENNSDLDDPDLPAEDRNMIIEENRVANSILRKLRKVLSEFEPDYLSSIDSLFRT